MIGYAVEQAEPTKTRPPYVLSNDPEDPIFYSTCYIYKSGVQWLPTVKQEVKRDWSMNTQCLRCDNYEANEANNAESADNADDTGESKEDVVDADFEEVKDNEEKKDAS